jgi:hypothetical protein
MSDDDPLSPFYGATNTGPTTPTAVRHQEADAFGDDGPGDDQGGEDDVDNEGIADEYADLGNRRRASVVTIALSIGVGLAVAFTGGVLVQKHHDAGNTAASSALPSGFPSGGAFPGLGSGAAGSAGGGTASGAGGGQASGATESGPVLVGTVVKVSGSTVTVRDFGGHTYLVSTTSSTAITKSSSVPLSSLGVGSSVSVEGTKSASTVQARSRQPP